MRSGSGMGIWSTQGGRVLRSAGYSWSLGTGPAVMLSPRRWWLAGAAKGQAGPRGAVGLPGRTGQRRKNSARTIGGPPTRPAPDGDGGSTSGSVASSGASSVVKHLQESGQVVVAVDGGGVEGVVADELLGLGAFALDADDGGV